MEIYGRMCNISYVTESYIMECHISYVMICQISYVMVDSHFKANGFFGKVSQQTGKLSQQSGKVSQHLFAVK